jgi:hypothetical protein
VIPRLAVSGQARADRRWAASTPARAARLLPGASAGPVTPAARAAWLLLAASAGAALALVPAPAIAAPTTVRHVVVVGAAGLRWDDVDQRTTPALWKLAGRGSIGALSVRATGALTCPADGWVTLGAGNRAQGPARTPGFCPQELPIREPVADGEVGARLVEQNSLANRNEARSFGARPGSLTDGVSCAGAVGQAGALAAAHPSGRIDRYVSELPANPEPLLGFCPLTVVGLDPVSGVDAAARRADLARIDATVAALDAARPASSLLVVVGVADTRMPPRLHVAILDGLGHERRWLTTASTHRTPFVQLTDVAPTVFSALNVAAPASLSGQPMRSGDARPADLGTALDELVDADRAAGAQRPLVQPFLTTLVLLNLGFIAVITVSVRWRVRRANAPAPRPIPFGVSPRRLLELGAIALAALLPASFLANAVPWWRLPASGLVHAVEIVAVAAGLTALAFAGRWGRTALGPPAFIAVVTALVLGLDVVFGSVLQLNSVAGYSPLVAGRFTGFGNLAFAVFATGALLATGYLAQPLKGPLRTVALVAGAVLSIAVVGAPDGGADVGGIIALTPAFVLLVLRASGLRLSVLTLAVAGGFGAVAISLFGLLDYARAPEDRTHLGRFVAQLSDGTAGAVLRRKAEANLSLLVDSQLTFLVIAVLVFLPVVLLRRSGGLRRVFGLYPTVRAGMIGVMVVAALGFAVNDSGIAVPAFAASLAVPLAVATTLRVMAGARRGIIPGNGAAGYLPAEVDEQPPYPDEPGAREQDQRTAQPAGAGGAPKSGQGEGGDR